ncbi:hypothetical protein VE03_09205 [Pseudogymnoascus sp. 23342-1-I1]|nr:hypothetical protein VE03_09205 [Pseudogymnoascus sp. 23342-1-I1]
MVKSHRAHPKLARDYGATQLARLSFCYEGMRSVFSINSRQQPPHSIIGNKARFATASALVDFLFNFEDGETTTSASATATGNMSKNASGIRITNPYEFARRATTATPDFNPYDALGMPVTSYTVTEID